MDDSNAVLEELLQKIRQINVGDYVDASDFLLKILSPSQPGQEDLLENLREGFRSRVIEPAFVKIEDIFQDLAKRTKAKDGQIYQLLDPLTPQELKDYKKQVTNILKQNIKSLETPTKSKTVSKILADPLNLVELSISYRKKAKEILDQEVKKLKSKTEKPNKITEAVEEVRSSNKTVKDIVPVAKNPEINPSLEAPVKEKQQASLVPSSSWSIGSNNPMLENTVKEKQQANLEAEAIEVTLSHKSLEALKKMLHIKYDGLKQTNSPPTVSKSADTEQPPFTPPIMVPGLGSRLWAAARIGGIAYGGYKILEWAVNKTEEWQKSAEAANDSIDKFSKRAKEGKVSPEATQKAQEYYEAAKTRKEFVEGKDAAVERKATKTEQRERLQSIVETLRLEVKGKQGVMGDPTVVDLLSGKNSEKQLTDESIESIETIRELQKIIEQLQDKKVDKPTPSKPGKSVLPLPTTPIDPHKLLPTEPPMDYLPDPLPVSNRPLSYNQSSKFNSEELAKQLKQTLSPLFDKLHGALVMINDNVAGSGGESVINNISSVNNSSSDSEPINSGRLDPIAAFRSEIWRNTSSNTRYT